MIQVARSMDEMWRMALWATSQTGGTLHSRVGECQEIVGWSCRLEEPLNNFLLSDARRLSSSYAAGELLWYLSQESSVERISAYAPSYVNFANDGHAHGAYGWRWANNPGIRASGYSTQFDAAIQLLKESPNTRQAVVVSWDSADVADSVYGQFKDIPCTVALQFLARDEKLHLVVFMRSNDVWLGMPYDVYCFTSIQRLMADALGLDVGHYTHSVGSLHLYAKNFDGANLALNEEPKDPELYACQYPTRVDRDDAIDALTRGDNYFCDLEEDGRCGEVEADDCNKAVLNWGRERTFMHDVVACCWHKTVPGFDAGPRVLSSALAKGLR